MDAMIPTLYGLFAQASQIDSASVEVVQQPTVSGGWDGYIVWLMAIVLFVGSFLLAQMLASAWQMKADTGRLFAFIFATAFGIVVCTMGWPPKLGIDLSGGTILQYSIDETKIAKRTFDQQDVDAITAALKPLASNVVVSIQPVAKNRLTISLPGASDTVLMKVADAMLQGNVLPGNRQVMPLPNTTDATQLNYELLAVAKGEMEKLLNGLKRRINPGGQKEISVRPIGEDQVEIIIPKSEPQDVAIIKENISNSGQLEFRIVANAKLDLKHKRCVELARLSDDDEVKDFSRGPTPLVIGRWVDLAKDQSPSDFPEVRPGRAGAIQALLYYDTSEGLPLITGDGMRANRGFDPKTNRDCISFLLPKVSANYFAALTKQYTISTLPTRAQLAIVLNNEIATAPSLQSAITDGAGIITGSYTDQQINSTITVLNSGALPSNLNKVPIQENTISAQLGEDTIRSGGTAMVIATLAILIFMWVYYGYCGFIANLCVLLNILLVVALMIPLQAVFTLAGLAGLVLSIGMAVDANVLIFERMREEVARGAALRMAIRNGFSRAMSTVVDSNLTTLVSGVVLFAIGTEQLRGFATTLILGLILNLFTAVYCARLLFDISERRGWFTKLNMMRMIGETKFDFVKPVTACVMGSCILIGLGLALAFARGKDFFDIDFTGGSTVQITLKDTAENKDVGVKEIRDLLRGKLEDLEVSKVVNSQNSKTFKLVSAVQDLNNSKEKLQEAFGARLENYQMTVSNAVAYQPRRTAPIVKPTDMTPAKSEPAKSEPAKTEAPKNDSPTSEAPKVETPKSEAPKTDAPKVEAPKTESAPQSGLYSAPSQLLAVSSFNPSAGLQLLNAGLLLQEVDPAKSVDATKADLPPVTTEPAKADGTTADAKKDDTSKAPAKDESPPAKTDTAPAKSPETKPDAALKTPGSESVEPAVSPYKSQTELTFFTISKGKDGGKDQVVPTPVSKEYLESLTKKILEKRKQELKYYEFKDPKQSLSSTAVSDKWTMVTALETAELDDLAKAIQAEVQAQPVFSQMSRVGSSVASTAVGNALWALAVSMLAIVLYVWFRFQNAVFGFAAVIALIHDVLITVGFLALSSYIAPYFGWAMISPFKISLEVVAALLTIVGFSINDTIVIFDRIRELRGKSQEISPDMVNRAVNQTLGRTVLTSGTVFIVTLILYIFGGEEIHPFSYAMLIGLISGTYSTVFIAAPIVLWFRRRDRVEAIQNRELTAAGRTVR